LVRSFSIDAFTYYDADNMLEVVEGHAAPGLITMFAAAARLVRMGRAALDDLGPPPDASASVDVHLVLPHRAAFYTASQRRLLVHALWAGRAEPVAPDRVNLHPTGRAGLADALYQAQAALATGRATTVLVGALDSLIDAEPLRALLEANRVYRTDLPAGLIPGEAACFLRLEAHTRADAGGVLLAAVRRAAETDPDAPVGSALSRAVAGVLRTADGPSDVDLYTDLNGEVDRAAEIGQALLLLSREVDVEPWAVVIPATSFGDTGAASGALACALAARAFARGYASAQHAVVALTSDGNYSGALCLQPTSITQ
jgi:3-oxoacyl-[acyl-carrier-protein] synthase-1